MVQEAVRRTMTEIVRGPSARKLNLGSKAFGDIPITMTLDSLPPLLRGIGTTVILATALVAIITARQTIEKQRRQAAQAAPIAALQLDPGLSNLTKEVAELRSEVEQQNVGEEVLESTGVEWLGLIGTAIIASSFYVEWYARKSANADGPGLLTA
jgi:hypothetical protein